MMRGHTKPAGGIYKIDTRSPTVSLELILITSWIDTAKERYVMVVDIPRSIPIVDMTKIVHIVLCGRLSELMAQLNPPIYRKYVRVENGQKVLYVQLKNICTEHFGLTLFFTKNYWNIWSHNGSIWIYIIRVWSTRWWTASRWRSFSKLMVWRSCTWTRRKCYGLSNRWR